MDNKFLEEAEKALNEIIKVSSEFNDWSINDRRNTISIIAQSLLSLSSKHKEDVRALREAVVAATKCPESENNPTHRCSALHCNYCGLCPANEDEATGIPKIIDAFDSTLKERGISL